MYVALKKSVISLYILQPYSKTDSMYVQSVYRSIKILRTEKKESLHITSHL